MIVTSLRKAEKAAAIKIKREEVEALRRALKKPAQQNQLINTAPSCGNESGLTDGEVELLQGSKDSEVRTGSAFCSHGAAQSYRQLEAPKELANRSTYGVGTPSPCGGNVEQLKLNSEAILKDCVAEPTRKASDSSAPEVRLEGEEWQGHHRGVFNSRDSSGDRAKPPPPLADGELKRLKQQYSEEIARSPYAGSAQKSPDSTALHFELKNELSSQDHHQEVSSSRDPSSGRPKLRPPVADVSPPLSARRSGREERRHGWSEKDGELDPADRGYCPGLAGTLGAAITGRVVGASTPGSREVEPLVNGHEDIARGEGLKRGSGHGGVDDSTYPPNRPDEAMISDNPLHR